MDFGNNNVNSWQNLTASDCRIFLEELEYQWSQQDEQDKFSKPMLWIGIYIAIASIFCILPMVVDLLHGLKNRKLWFPCKYFTLNAASLTVIAIAMKLPMDLNNSMPGDVDQAAKLGSMAFMCTMMANLLPSLASMNTKELLTNIIALGVLVITLVVNVCIQIQTGVVSHYGGVYFSFLTDHNHYLAITYVIMLLFMLTIHICSALVILKSKQILESRYQARHETTLRDLELQQPESLIVEKLRHHVHNHWIMAETGSPQFMTVCFATTSASGVICALSTVLHVIIMIYTSHDIMYYESDYKWSISVILITQFVGVAVGTIAPIFRCFSSLSFKLSIKRIWSHIKVFKVESYYTHKLSDWKQSNIPFSSKSRRCKFVIETLKVLILSLCIGFQKVVVVACKLISFIPILFVTCLESCWKWSEAMFNVLGILLVKKTEQIQENQDLSKYVLQLEDDIELAERTLKGISKAMNRVIQKAEKQQPKHLMKLLEESSSFEGVGKYDMDQVPPLSAEKYVDCWSLPVVTLTTIAISLPNIQTKKVEWLLKSVTEGLAYVKLVEETLNTTDKYVSIQQAAKRLWLEVDVYHKWLGNNLQNLGPQVNTAGKILQWFSDTAKNMVTDVESTDSKVPNDNSKHKSVCANSMYRVAQTILLSYSENIDQVSHEELFLQLTNLISDILAACLTNLPQVIALKCHESAIEEREASVHAAAQLLGETMHIINSLQDRDLPSLPRDDLAFIDKWRDYLKHPFPL